ncbi:MAG: hypothetical protein WBA41_25425 [Rivularia sp. (in: cyanobacteria)]
MQNMIDCDRALYSPEQVYFTRHFGSNKSEQSDLNNSYLLIVKVI